MTTRETATQADRMRTALAPVLEIGPDFLAGRQDADAMAHTMVGAVEGYVQSERARHSAGTADTTADGAPPTRAVRELEAALVEVYSCGSGYLADRCDAACVTRTMTQIVEDFGGAPAAR